MEDRRKQNQSQDPEHKRYVEDLSTERKRYLEDLKLEHEAGNVSDEDYVQAIVGTKYVPIRKNQGSDYNLGLPALSEFSEDPEMIGNAIQNAVSPQQQAPQPLFGTQGEQGMPQQPAQDMPGIVENDPIFRAVKNIKDTINGDRNMNATPTDDLMARLKQFQRDNIESQGQSIGETKKQLAALGKKVAQKTGFRDPVIWAALSDTFGHNDKKLVPLALKLRATDTTTQDKFNLQKVLLGQHRNMGDASNAMVDQIMAERKAETEAAGGGDLADKMAFLKEQARLAGERDAAKSGYAIDLETLRQQGRIAKSKANAKYFGVGAGRQRTSGEGPGGEPTTFSKKFDMEAATNLAEWANSGLANAQLNLENITQSIEALETAEERGENLTGTAKTDLFGLLKKPLDTGIPLKMTPRTISNPESKAREERVRFYVQQSLKEILGGQFARAEGEQMVRNSYNVNLDEKENASRLRLMQNQLITAAQIKNEMLQYAHKWGTLDKYTPPPIKVTLPNGETRDLTSFLKDEAKAVNTKFKKDGNFNATSPKSPSSNNGPSQAPAKKKDTFNNLMNEIQGN